MKGTNGIETDSSYRAFQNGVDASDARDDAVEKEFAAMLDCHAEDVMGEAVTDRADPSDVARVLTHLLYPKSLCVDYTLAQEKGYGTVKAQVQYSLDRIKEAAETVAQERAEHDADNPW